MAAGCLNKRRETGIPVSLLSALRDEWKLLLPWGMTSENKDE
jgi:hypothetical protein